MYQLLETVRSFVPLQIAEGLTVDARDKFERTGSQQFGQRANQPIRGRHCVIAALLPLVQAYFYFKSVQQN